jgi:hypothetical protein
MGLWKRNLIGMFSSGIAERLFIMQSFHKSWYLRKSMNYYRLAMFSAIQVKRKAIFWLIWS